jgi:hypothetical protein
MKAGLDRVKLSEGNPQLQVVTQAVCTEQLHFKMCYLDAVLVLHKGWHGNAREELCCIDFAFEALAVKVCKVPCYLLKCLALVAYVII